MHDIKNGPIPGVKDHSKPRGPRPAYPFDDMEIGQWMLVPFAEERRLNKAAKNAKYNRGVHVQIQLSTDGKWWIVLRVP